MRRNSRRRHPSAAEKCLKKLLARYSTPDEAEILWEKIQLKYADFLSDEPAHKDRKVNAGIYGAILIFAWYDCVPDKPTVEEIQDDVFECFMGGFKVLGKLFDLNKPGHMKLAGRTFKSANDQRARENEKMPGGFVPGEYEYDEKNGIVRYSFLKCPNAEFAKKHHLEAVLPAMCNCDHIAMEKLHAKLVRTCTCGVGSICDYCIMGDRNPAGDDYVLAEENGLLLSREKSI